MITKKGSLLSAIVMIASISAFAIFLIIVGYIGNTVSTELKTKLNNDTTQSGAINSSFDATINVATNMLGSLWWIAFGGLLIGVLVSAWFIRTYPIFLPIFLFLLIVLVMLGVAMSNAYELITDNPTLSTTASQQGSVGFFMNNLPYVGFIVGLIAIIIIFVKPKEANQYSY